MPRLKHVSLEALTIEPDASPSNGLRGKRRVAVCGEARLAAVLAAVQ